MTANFSRDRTSARAQREPASQWRATARSAATPWDPSPKMAAQRRALQAAFGDAARGKGVVQGYDLSYGALRNGCGTDMHVYIDGANDKDLNKGSPPSVVPNWWPTSGAAAPYLSQYAVQGHLLNQDLGGPGNTMENLAPITRSTNTTHFTNIEKAVKTAVAQDMGVEYRVRAYYDGVGPPLSDFGSGAPPDLQQYLQHFPHEIGADYDIYDRQNVKKTGGLPGEKFIKNEGAHLKGTYL